MPSNCISPIIATRMRIVRLDACGTIVTGATGSIVTKGFIKVEAKRVYEAGTEYLVKNAGDELCVNDKRPDKLKRIDLGITLCEVDPQAIEMMTAARLITVGGTAVGNGFSEDPNTGGWALELWQEIAGGACSGTSQQWVHHVFPWVRDGALGDLAFENAPQQWLVNASTKKNPNYGDGPANLWAVPIPANEHHAYQVTTVAPPAPACGYQQLVSV